MNNKEILCVLSLAEAPSGKLILISLSFHHYHCFHNSLVDCTKEAAVHQHGEKKNSRQLFFNIASWSHFFCHGSVNTAKQGGDGFLICCHFSVAVWKHDNRSSGHAFLYVRTARILMSIYESWCLYTNLDVYITVLSCKFTILLFCPFLTSILLQYVPGTFSLMCTC